MVFNHNIKSGAIKPSRIFFLSDFVPRF